MNLRNSRGGSVAVVLVLLAVGVTGAACDDPRDTGPVTLGLQPHADGSLEVWFGGECDEVHGLRITLSTLEVGGDLTGWAVRSEDEDGSTLEYARSGHTPPDMEEAPELLPDRSFNFEEDLSDWREYDRVTVIDDHGVGIAGATWYTEDLVDPEHTGDEFLLLGNDLGWVPRGDFTSATDAGYDTWCGARDAQGSVGS